MAYTYEGDEVLIPNTLLAESAVQNLTRNHRLHRIELSVRVAYKSDLALVRKTLEETTDRLDAAGAVLIGVRHHQNPTDKIVHITPQSSFGSLII
jgi:small-conductance mechanosensitive channel